jgi:hypothetical protein
VEFKLLQAVLFDLFLSCENVFLLELIHQPVVLHVLVSELAKALIRLHQVRFDFFFDVPIHSRHFSSVELPRRTEWNENRSGG